MSDIFHSRIDRLVESLHHLRETIILGLFQKRPVGRRVQLRQHAIAVAKPVQDVAEVLTVAVDERVGVGVDRPQPFHTALSAAATTAVA